MDSLFIYLFYLDYQMLGFAEGSDQNFVDEGHEEKTSSKRTNASIRHIPSYDQVENANTPLIFFIDFVIGFPFLILACMSLLGCAIWKVKKSSSFEFYSGKIRAGKSWTPAPRELWKFCWPLYRCKILFEWQLSFCKWWDVMVQKLNLWSI